MTDTKYIEALNKGMYPPITSNYRFHFLSYFIRQKYKTLLDVGFGNGQFLEYFTWKGMDVTGLEKPHENVEKYKSLGFKTVQYDLDKKNLRLPFEDNSFDVVICTDVLEHLKNPKDVLDEMYRVSKEMVLVTVPAGESYYSPEHINFWYKTKDLKDSLVPDHNDCTIFVGLSRPQDWEMKQGVFVMAVYKNKGE